MSHARARAVELLQQLLPFQDPDAVEEFVDALLDTARDDANDLVQRFAANARAKAEQGAQL